jgi:hypothetical protein
VSIVRDILIVVFGLLLLFPLQKVIDDRRPPPLELTQTLSPEPLLPVLAFGHRESAADVLEIRVTNALIKRLKSHSRLDRDELWRLYGAIMGLDPQNAEACFRGSVYLSSIADSADTAVSLLALSLGEEDPDFPAPPGSRRTPVHPDHPRRWLLYHEWAAINFLMFRQRAKTPEREAHFARRAGQLWMLAAQQPGAPEWFLDVGRKLAGRGLTRREALEHELRLWGERAKQGDDYQRRRAEARLLEVQCAHMAELLQEKVDALLAKGKVVTHLRELPWGDDVKDKTHLSDIDPMGVGYFLDGKRVVAPANWAAKEGRIMQDAFIAWKERHPEGPTPTREDLRIKDQPHLLVTVSPEGVSVQGRIPAGF